MPVRDSFPTALLSFWGCFPSPTPPPPSANCLVGRLARDFFVPPAASVSPLVRRPGRRVVWRKPGTAGQGRYLLPFCLARIRRCFGARQFNGGASLYLFRVCLVFAPPASWGKLVLASSSTLLVVFGEVGARGSQRLPRGVTGRAEKTGCFVLPCRSGESRGDCFDDKAPERAPVGTRWRRLDSLGHSQDHDSFEPGFTYREALGILAAKVSGSANVTGGLVSPPPFFLDREEFGLFAPLFFFPCGPSKVEGGNRIEEEFPRSIFIPFCLERRGERREL